MPNELIDKVYAAQTVEEQQAGYDAWAKSYEPDLCAMGYRVGAVVAATFAAYVPQSVNRILDAGCGGGIQTEPLALLGYKGIVGIDLSEGMLGVARGKGIYDKLICMPLGAKLDFPDGSFDAVLSSGTITPGHAPPDSFEELIRVCKPKGKIIFSLRDDKGQDPAYPQAITDLVAAGKWRHVFTTPSFQAMPYGEPDVTDVVHVYETTGL